MSSVVTMNPDSAVVTVVAEVNEVSRSTPRETPADWNEVVRYLHAIFAFMITGIYGFFPKPTIRTAVGLGISACNLAANQTLPFVAQPHKTLELRAFDVFVGVCFVGWGATCIQSLRQRGKFQGRICDCISLSFAYILLSLLLTYLNPDLLVISAIMLPLVGFFLSDVRKVN